MLKEYILENNFIQPILEELGCHHISQRDGFVQCANPDGDNNTAVCVYENTNLTTINYTRDISRGKNMGTDLISLVEFYHDETFPYAVKWICETIGLDYYSELDEDLPESLRLTRMLIEMEMDLTAMDKEKPLKPISEDILKYYHPYVNDMFLEDGVSYETQQEFEVGYDEASNRITIPIRDDLGNLVGIKGRYFYREVPEDEQKFVYLERCAKSQILYGLHKTMPAIQRMNRVFVVEAEKGVQQLYGNGYMESVSTGGKTLSRYQIEKLTRLCVPVYLVFDKDVSMEELTDLAYRFIDGVDVYALFDSQNILNDKESPTDNMEKFKRLLDECVVRLK